MRVIAREYESAELIHLVWGPIAILFIAMAGIMKGLAVLMPKCLFHEITGYPCFTCGGTRSIIALSQFDLLASFLYNPIVPLFMGGVILLSLIALMKAILKKSFSLEFSDMGKKILRYSIFIFLAINWIFLVMVGR